MKSQARSVLIFIFIVAVAAASFSQSQPVNSAQLMAWLASGVPTGRLIRIVQQRGISGALGKDQIGQFASAGADGSLLRAISNRALSNLKTSGSGRGSANNSTSAIPAFLIQVATDARAHRFHEAELTLRQVLESDPQNAALHFALGAMLSQQEQWDDAFDEFTRSAQLMPDFPENHANLAYIFYRLDDGPNAIAEARTALSMDPQNAEAYQFLGLGLYSNGQYAAAVHAFLESLARDANNADSYYDLGITLHDDGDLPAASAVYRQAIQLRPAFWQARSNLAMTLHEQNRLDEAITEYREAKRLAPEQASVRNNLGNTYCDKGDFDAALSELRELYREHPEWQQGHGCLARAYLSKKDYGNAIEQLRLAVQENPTGAAEHRALGEALVLTDKLEDAVRELRVAVSLNPDSDAAHHVLGTALFQQQQLQAAEKEFREALRLNASPENHYALAACLMNMDRYDEALTELETASRLEPGRQLYRARRDELMQLMKETNSR